MKKYTLYKSIMAILFTMLLPSCVHAQRDNLPVDPSLMSEFLKKEKIKNQKQAVMLKAVATLRKAWETDKYPNKPELENLEKILLGFRGDPDAPLSRRNSFALAHCQEKLGKNKQALESYREMRNGYAGSCDDEIGMGYYALLALNNRQYSEAISVVQECINSMKLDPAYAKDYDLFTDVPMTSNTDVIRAHVYLLLSNGITKAYVFDAARKKQDYLKKSIELGRGTTPNAYLRMAQYTRFSDPVQSRKYLEDIAKMYKKYPMHAEEARKRLKDYPPVENEKSAGK
jgi:hypothetical protein